MSSFKPPWMALGIATLLLTGCAPVVSKTDTSACPPLVTYSPEDQMAAAGEIIRLPVGSVLVRFLADYATLRDQIRACRPLR